MFFYIALRSKQLEYTLPVKYSNYIDACVHTLLLGKHQLMAFFETTGFGFRLRLRFWGFTITPRQNTIADNEHHGIMTIYEGNKETTTNHQACGDEARRLPESYPETDESEVDVIETLNNGGKTNHHTDVNKIGEVGVNNGDEVRHHIQVSKVDDGELDVSDSINKNDKVHHHIKVSNDAEVQSIPQAYCFVIEAGDETPEEKSEEGWRSGDLRWTANDLRESQLNDEDIGPVLRWKESREVRTGWGEISPEGKVIQSYWTQWERVQVRHGVLYRKWESALGEKVTWQLVLPSNLRSNLMKFLHCEPASGHLGRTKTTDRIQQRKGKVGLVELL